jgi:hypothetical protein
MSIHQLQDPQEDNIRDAKDLILAPDSMEYYREQKLGEQVKAKREQEIAEAAALQKQEARQKRLSAASAKCVSIGACVGMAVRNWHAREESVAMYYDCTAVQYTK